MKKLIFVLPFVLCLLFLVIPVLAVSPTPTPAEDADTSTRAQEIKQLVKEKVQEVKNNVKKRGFWGTLKEVSNSTLVVSTSEGDRLVKIDSQPKFVIGQKEGKLGDLALGNFLIVMGNLDTNNTFTAKRIMALTTAPKPPAPRQAVFGKVTDISKEESVLVITPPKKDGLAYEVKTTDQTTITKKAGNKVQKVEFGVISVGDWAVVVATKGTQANTLAAKIIHIIPGLSKTVSPIPAD